MSNTLGLTSRRKRSRLGGQSQNWMRGILQFFMYHCIAFVCAAESAFGDLPVRAWHIRCNSVFSAAEKTCRTLCITRSPSVTVIKHEESRLIRCSNQYA